jgi:hypothetical protein
VSSVVEQIHAELGDLIGEIGQKNRVRVTVHRALPKGQGRTWAWSRGEVVSDITGVGKSSEGEMLPLLPHLVMMDELRMLVGKRPQFLPEAMRRTGGEFISVTPNLRTTVGIDYVASALGDSSGSRAAVAQYIALTNNTSAPAVGDTSATTTAGSLDWGTASATDAAASNSRGEYTALGVARALAAYAHTGGTANYTMSKTFTATGTVTALQACGLFNNSAQAAGTLFVENTFTATSLATNDQLTIQWTVSI